MVEVHCVDVESFEESLFPLFLSLLPKEEQEAVLSYKCFKDRRLSLLGRLIVRRYFSLKGDVPGPMKRDETGKPYIEGAKPFSVSHSGNIAGAAFSERKIGLDIERWRPWERVKDIAERFRPGGYESAAGGREKAAAFFDDWTRAEAFLKASGAPLGALAGVKGERWFFQSGAMKGAYSWALCQDAPLDAWKIVELCYNDLRGPHQCIT
ncbi:MAG: hypothetical protein LBS82_03400 [Spirochaetaceae bacterium]|jgi:phosphopantetheinyl transferase|nr:hypothetical protein [Spirochaetaceae bacterium]